MRLECMTVCLRLYDGSGAVSGVSTGGGEAVVCAKSGSGKAQAWETARVCVLRLLT